jgi:hypothetical protein
MSEPIPTAAERLELLADWMLRPSGRLLVHTPRDGRFLTPTLTTFGTAPTLAQ